MLGTWPLKRRDICWRFKTSMIKPSRGLWKALRLAPPQVRGPGLEELSEGEAQLQAMSDDDPDLAPKEWAQSEKATDVALSPPPQFPKGTTPPRSNALMRSVLRCKLGTLTRCKLCTTGVKKGWPLRVRQRLKGNCLKGAESGFHSQEHSLQEGNGLSGSFSHEEGWILVKRRKDKKASHKEEKKREGKAIKKVLCKDKVSSLICRAPSLRTGKKTSSFKSPNFVDPSSIVQDPGIKGAFFSRSLLSTFCCQGCWIVCLPCAVHASRPQD